MPKEKDDDARAEGFKRGLKGKRDAVGVTQGWTDDKTSGVARTEGWVAGSGRRRNWRRRPQRRPGPSVRSVLRPRERGTAP